MQTIVFSTNGVIGVPMINVDASAGKRRAGDCTKEKEKPSLEKKKHSNSEKLVFK